MESISWQDQDGARWIELEGELDGAACLQLKDRFHEAVDGGDGDVVLVLDGVTFLSSTAAGLFIEAYKSLRQKDRSLRLQGTRPPVKNALRLMALDRLFPID